MRSPGPAFDVREALSEEVRKATEFLDARTAHGVHRCRVHIKRARALARVGRACAPGLYDVFNDSARATMAALAKARDPVALADAAHRIATETRKRKAEAVNAVAAALEADRAAAAALDLSDAHAGLRDLLALAQVWPEASARQIRRGANRLIRRARAARHDADTPDHRHRWRKREKDRLYAAQILGSAWPKRRRRKLGEKLSDALGQERDAQLLIDRLQHAPELAGGARAAGHARKAIERWRDTCAARADQLGARLHADGA